VADIAVAGTTVVAVYVALVRVKVGAGPSISANTDTASLSVYTARSDSFKTLNISAPIL
jgi:hypothetical protein